MEIYYGGQFGGRGLETGGRDQNSNLNQAVTDRGRGHLVTVEKVLVIHYVNFLYRLFLGSFGTTLLFFLETSAIDECRYLGRNEGMRE